MKKEIYGKGLFVLNDKDGNPLHVGDYVRATRPPICIEFEHGDDVNIPKKVFEGILILRKSMGVVIRLENGEVVRPKFTDLARNVWQWEKISHTD